MLVHEPEDRPSRLPLLALYITGLPPQISVRFSSNFFFRPEKPLSCCPFGVVLRSFLRLDIGDFLCFFGSPRRISLGWPFRPRGLWNSCHSACFRLLRCPTPSLSPGMIPEVFFSPLILEPSLFLQLAFLLSGSLFFPLFNELSPSALSLLKAFDRYCSVPRK